MLLWALLCEKLQIHLLTEMIVQMTRISWYGLNERILAQMMVQTPRAVDLPPE